MSIFASATQATIPIPFDPPHTVTARKLTGREVEVAQEAHAGSIASGRSRAWAQTFRRMLEKGASDPDVLKAIADPLTGYDRFSLVRSGLIAWSYPQSVPPYVNAAKHAAEVEADPSKADAIDDLDDEAVDFIATEILRLTKPALFQTTIEAEADRKNG